MPKCILAEQGGKGGGSGIVLMKIEVTTKPTKTSYLAGDSFNSADMVVTASSLEELEQVELDYADQAE